MSEKQGGQHEVGLKPVQAAASFFTTLTVDCQNRDLVNIWRAVDLNGGDFLSVELQFAQKTDDGLVHFVLNHYYKSTVARTIKFHKDLQFQIQLVPTVFTLNPLKTLDSWHNSLINKLCLYIKCCTDMSQYKDDHKQLDAQVSEFANYVLDYPGYWHIGQTYTKKTKFVSDTVPVNDMLMTTGQLLQINFAPVWKGISMYSVKKEDRHYSPNFFLRQLSYTPANSNGNQTLNLPLILVEILVGEVGEVGVGEVGMGEVGMVLLRIMLILVVIC
jgi:hypothetical protein